MRIAPADRSIVSFGYKALRFGGGLLVSTIVISAMISAISSA
jgi:hypothetical protein